MYRAADENLNDFFFIKITHEGPKQSEEEDAKSSTSQASKQEQEKMSALGVTNDHIVMTLNRAFIDLVMKANGKADLYFHSYFIERYLKSLIDF